MDTTRANIFVRSAKGLVGPISRDQLDRMRIAGEVAENDLVSENRGPWIPLLELGGSEIQTRADFRVPTPNQLPARDPKTLADASSRWQRSLALALALVLAFLVAAFGTRYWLTRSAAGSLQVEPTISGP